MGMKQQETRASDWQTAVVVTSAVIVLTGRKLTWTDISVQVMSESFIYTINASSLASITYACALTDNFEIILSTIFQVILILTHLTYIEQF